MPQQIVWKGIVSPCSREFIIIFFIVLFNGVTAKTQNKTRVIGAIIDVNTRVGRDERVSMELAVAAYNNISRNQNKLLLQVTDSSGDPIKASTAAQSLIRDKQVEAIIGMETWLEAALVAEIANKAQVPVLSFAAPSVTTLLASPRWPFLLKMASTGPPEMKCIASIVHSYEWTRVIVISEDDSYGTISGTLKLLADELVAVGSEIEYWSAFPPFKTLPDPKAFVQEELEILNSKQSRVFILVGSSFELAKHILTRANHDGLMGKDSVWITTDPVTNLLDAVETSDILSTQGLIGIKTHIPENNPSFKEFCATFHTLFCSTYPNEKASKPGFYAVRAYDAISSIAVALDKPRNPTSSSTRGKFVLENILSSNFVGLSGEVRFEDGELSGSRTYEITNIVGKNYYILKYWSVEYGFSDKVCTEKSHQKKKNGPGSEISQVLGPRVNWPGNVNRVPNGWVMPSKEDPIVIGVPGRGTFEEFVKVNYGGEEPTGFCISVFKKAVSLLDYDVRYILKPLDVTYDELVNLVHNKTVGAVVGDITILARRSKLVQFTQSYAESSLTMLVPVTTEDKAWLIVKPFTPTLWLVICGLFLYVTFTVWFLEYKSNPDSPGQWRNQLCATIWLTSSTIFFTHRGNLHNNFTRVVMFIWLITVFIITSSYTASLASMFTVKRLEPTVTDIDSLRTSNAHVGCYSSSFVRRYLEDVLHLHPENIINFRSANEYPEAFRNGTIRAAFTELPYARAFLARYPKGYMDVALKPRFGGLGFVFPKGSPLARDLSEAILRLSEDGTLGEIWEHWFKPQSRSSNSEDNETNERLGLNNFRLLFLLTFVISTITVVLHAIKLITEHRSTSTLSVGTTPNANNTVQNIEVFLSSNRKYSSHDFERQPSSTLLTGTELASRYHRDSKNQLRGLKVAYSFPGWGGRVCSL